MNRLKTIIHHCVMHPVAGVLYFFGLYRAGDRVHLAVLDPGTG